MAELDLQEVARRLDGPRLRGPLLYRPRTGSTNDDALALAARGAAEGTVVIAGEQTDGRGRKQRTWFGHPDGSLLFSVILRLPLPAEHFPRLVNMGGVAVAEGCIAAAGLEVGTKWPNDIMLGGCKVGGILVEARAPEYAVVGVGLNVLGEASDLPPELRETAGFLAVPGTHAPRREAVLTAVIAHLDYWYDLLLGGQFGRVLERQRELETSLGGGCRVRVGDAVIAGTATGLSASGGLVLQTAQGPRVIEVGEVL